MNFVHCNHFRYERYQLPPCAGQCLNSSAQEGGGGQLQLTTQNNIFCNRSKEFPLIHLCQLYNRAMGDLSKEQEQAIARSTMYLFAAVLTILMVSIAGLFISAELEQQAQLTSEISIQISSEPDVGSRPKRPWTRWSRQESAMLPTGTTA